MTTYVLNVEGIANWKSDCAGGFSFLGLSDRSRNRLDTLKPPDVIVTYVTGTGFVDVREITEPGTTRLRTQSYPEGVWPWQVKTRLVASLDLARALSPNTFPHTKLCSGDWRHRFRQSGRVLDPEDGRVIAEAIIKAASA